MVGSQCLNSGILYAHFEVFLREKPKEQDDARRLEGAGTQIIVGALLSDESDSTLLWK
jgi:hypothetical protein